MRIHSRELAAVNGFTDASFKFLNMLEDDNLRAFAARLTDGITLIGHSELHARQMERCQTLGIQPNRRAFAQEQFKSLNERGRTTVLNSLGKLKELHNDFEENASTRRTVSSLVKEARAQLYGLLVDLVR
jgi:hypothetical protein